MKIRKILLAIEKISFSYKTSILMFIIIGGMISIIVLSQISIYTIKNDFDVLFEKRTKPILKLEAIKDAYLINIQESILDVHNQNIDLEDSYDVIILGEQIIKDNWAKYLKINFSDEYEVSFITKTIKKLFTIGNQNQNKILQRSIISNISEKIKRMDILVSEILVELKNPQSQNIKTLIQKVNFEVNAISIYLTNLTNYDLNMAISEKRDTQNIFNTLSMILNISIIFVFVFSIVLSVMIIIHFRKLHFRLKDAVNEKTKELLKLNQSLERRIANEVANSRKKDLIMFQQARLASLGEMIANIAHQWRQPLASLMMIIQGFETKMELGKLTPEILKQKVDDATLLGENMSKTIEDFQNFFKPSRDKEMFSLKRCIEHSFELSKYLLEKEKIEFFLNIKDDEQIYGFYNELSHVFLNIISNSKDALSDKEYKRLIEVVVKKSKNKIRVNIVDNGGGIDEDILPHIFEPYYTTKYKSSGTGIGLYMSQQIVEKQMNGKIECKNIYYKIQDENFQKCTIFSITIPLKDENDN
ncbi:histidine kinase [Sulfurimonas denitrificans DSM 1251]|uniref:histidine kinase n=1 Tax=Sulfurimonas denitrificans (strain ATCC 33889 / DSM 1251) TaxID=326298 RepID=Q30SC6_SULDN|nr:HAMP domain-containing sensor histidine kinase [Sulfurimonas denitrificans]ABB44105.1 histidine kinase [Sulfurimonas denitrificans DSM 1251]MDD3441888.1 HAMP domain-containing sensor histidine kinase [Sulfurimonas denitrificans]